MAGSEYRDNYERLQNQLLAQQGLAARSSDIELPGICRIHVLEFGDQYRAYQQRTPWRLLPFVY